MTHHAIIVTSKDSEALRSVRTRAREQFNHVTLITPVNTEGYESFMIPEECTEIYKGHLLSNDKIDWVQVHYGDKET